MPSLPNKLTIGQTAARGGVRTSALRYYESLGLISSERTAGDQRRYARETLRRIAVIRAAQLLGLTLREIRVALNELPQGRTPDQNDWQRLSRNWRGSLDQRIADLQALRDRLSGCIGCGCLSLETCALFNPADRAAQAGAGAQYLFGEEPDPGSEPASLRRR
ncbi:MAG: redox-sensitive transcriptional activator SoxR [Chloroflexi bacterium]|nr:redox-sensitive transcriptional activator SoxR [Chloroflexota bacterium]